MPPLGVDDASYGGDIIKGRAVEGMCGVPHRTVNELLSERRREDAKTRSIFKDEEEFIEKMELDLYKAGCKGRQVYAAWFDIYKLLQEITANISFNAMNFYAKKYFKKVYSRKISIYVDYDAKIMAETERKFKKGKGKPKGGAILRRRAVGAASPARTTARTIPTAPRTAST